jgi:hypothetical protein
MPDGTDAYAHAKKLGRFKMVRNCGAPGYRVEVGGGGGGGGGFKKV